MCAHLCKIMRVCISNMQEHIRYHRTIICPLGLYMCAADSPMSTMFLAPNKLLTIYKPFAFCHGCMTTRFDAV